MKTTLALTCGDPAGIGPEIIVKTVQRRELHERARLLLVGSHAVIADAVARLGSETEPFEVDDPAAGFESSPQRLPVHHVGNLTPRDFRVGEVAAATGRDSVAYVEAAARLAREGLVNGIVTAPINKESMRAAGVPYPGHTEILGAALDSHVETMFVVDDLRIFFLTRHLSLRDAIEAISGEGLLRLLGHARGVLQELGIERPRIAVAGLNPHAGDGGIFGREEIAVLQPAVEEAVGKGWDVIGPIGADSVFHQCLQGRYDAVISLYHDQGHIAAKTYDFDRTVSVTTGLPVVRTSVDHGTAFDIAGQGVADPTNMVEAVRVATEMTLARLTRSAHHPPRDRRR